MPGEVSFVLPGSAAATTVVAIGETDARFLSEEKLREALAERLLRTNYIVTAPAKAGEARALRRV